MVKDMLHKIDLLDENVQLTQELLEEKKEIGGVKQYFFPKNEPHKKRSLSPTVVVKKKVTAHGPTYFLTNLKEKNSKPNLMNCS